MGGRKLVYLIRSLNRGGAERQLALLAVALMHRGYQVAVVVFYSGGVFESFLRSNGVALVSLEKKGRWDVVGFVLRLYRMLRREQPDVLYAFSGTSNMLAVLMKFLLPNMKVVLRVLLSHIEFDAYPWLVRAAYWLECRLSHWADLIICNSHAGKTYAARHGFPISKMIVVANGIDTAEFGANLEARQRLRTQWNVGSKNFLVGLVARLDPMKDHETFLRSLAILTPWRPDLRAICVGERVEPYKTRLLILAESLKLGNVLTWAEARDDMPAVYSALDVLVSASIGEGFSNVIGEAMACGVPCVVTDVGDSALIVGETGFVVPPRDPKALAHALERMIGSVDAARRGAARNRVESYFSLERLSADTDTALQRVMH